MLTYVTENSNDSPMTHHQTAHMHIMRKAKKSDIEVDATATCYAQAAMAMETQHKIYHVH